MAEQTTVARPYAQAVFDLARKDENLKGWSQMLAFAAAVASDPNMVKIIASPKLDAGQAAELFLDVCGEHLDDQGRNLIKVLAENRRLAVLPEIYALYEELRAEAESIIEAELISAAPVKDAHREKVAEALEKRLGRKVNLTCTEDESLLGGAVIRAGDLVIDGSVKGKLARLATTLSH